VELLISARSLENGELNSTRHDFDAALTLGRGAESPLPLDGTGISREHLRLHAEGDKIFVTDLSSNGTWLNTRRLTRGEPQPLTPSDTIKIPGFEIGIHVPNAPAQIEVGTAGEPVRAGGPLEMVRAFERSLSTGEKFLIVLALATLVLVATYFSA
jgi:pSer/pThr/pTyr-binding forkhead associated (FHA) protein